MSEYAIEVENLCISYKGLKSYSIKRNLFQKKGKSELFQAVKNVSFKVEKGEILGIIGKNGSGKSTMLRAIAGIFSPNSGTIDLHGHSVSLLAIGVGFQKELTGRENILLSGMLLGFSEKEIQERIQEIIDFSELGQFIDAPVRTYSSGMYSKLAFSITAVLETDIILIDEVLSVGDAHFRRKSYNRMRQMIFDKDRTVAIVSHDMRTISELCTKVLWVNDGELMRYGNTDEILPEYERFMTEQFPEVASSHAIFRAEVAGSNLSYQWQFRVSETAFWRLATAKGNQTAALHVPITPTRKGYQYRCIVTDLEGNVSFSQIYTMELPEVEEKVEEKAEEKTEAPQEVPDNIAVFHAGVEDSNLTYQWQFHTAESTVWCPATAEGNRTAVLRVPITPIREGNRYRCVMTDADGNVRFSETYTLGEKRKAPEQKIEVPENTTTFHVDMEGDGLAYQWQFRTAGSLAWYPASIAGNKTATLYIPMTPNRNGNQYRCIVTDETGEVRCSEVYTLEIPVTDEANENLPENSDEFAVFRAGAVGNCLSYQWQYRFAGTKFWHPASIPGNKTATLCVPRTLNRNGNQYRCVIIDADGNVSYSDIHTLKVSQ